MAKLPHETSNAIVKDTTAMRVTLIALPCLDMVLAVLDALGAEKMVQLISAGILADPFTHGVIHLPLDLDSIVSDCRMMEGAKDIVDDFVDGYSGVLPGV
jgi:hypothetical protein